MRSALTTLFIVGCLALIIQGSYGYIKGKINIRQPSSIEQMMLNNGYTEEQAEKKIKNSIVNSIILVISGAIGIYIVIYYNNRPPKRNRVQHYKP